MSAPTALAWARAHALASAHGHAWACLRPVPASSKEAYALWASVGADELGPCGGLGPALHHATGTGRLRWEVEPSGVVNLVVARPAGDVIRAVADKAGIVRVDLVGEACLRHWDVLRVALKALGLRLPAGIIRDIVEASAELWGRIRVVEGPLQDCAVETATRFDASAEAILSEECKIALAAQAAVARARHLTREAAR